MYESIFYNYEFTFLTYFYIIYFVNILCLFFFFFFWNDMIILCISYNLNMNLLLTNWMLKIN